jgi:hypothetical protein
VNGIRKAIAYAVLALAALSSLTGVIGWMFPSSATWVIHHGLIAWILAVIFFFSFTGTFTNLLDKHAELRQANEEATKARATLQEEIQKRTLMQKRSEEEHLKLEQIESSLRQSNAELEAIHAKAKEAVKQDRDLFEKFKEELPRDNSSLVWLRQRADSTIYHDTDRKPLWEFCLQWKDADYHFVDEELDRAATRLISALDDFLTYQGLKAEEIPGPPDGNRRFRVINYNSDDYTERSERETRDGLANRANKILSAYNNLYDTDSRMGM